MAFLAGVVASERAVGHETVIIRMDRAPEHEGREMRQGLNNLGVQLELTPRNRNPIVAAF